MDWFQHRSKCMDGTLFKIFHKFNADGYYIYWRVVEILADGDHLIKPKKNIREWWEKEIMKEWSIIEPVMDLMASEGMIELSKGDEISVLCPNLGVLNPEWLRKLQYREEIKTSKDGTGTEQGRNKSVLKENKREVKENKVKETKIKDPRVKVLIDYFFDKHLEEKKKKVAINGGQDGKVFQDLLETFTEEEIKDKIDKFMVMKDNWMIDNQVPFTVGVFKTKINQVDVKEKSTNTYDPKADFMRQVKK